MGRRICVILLASSLVAMLTANAAGAAPPSHKAKPRSTATAKVVKRATPLPVPRARPGSSPARAAEGPGGPPVAYKGVSPSGAASRAAAKRADTSGAYWPGAYNKNPNLQVGKLYFWTGSRWSSCSGTAINSTSKSLVLTAGHCVYDTINNHWYTGVRFCPGYEFGCKLGTWYASRLGTSSSWVNSTSTNYNWADDIGVVKVSQNPNNGYLVNYVGGQGITFNQSVGLYRTAFGYPAPDYRWPQYNWNGEDLVYCQAYSVYDNAGHLRIPCTMTGGASGGSWLSYVASNWLGYANGVNSHKAWGGAYMGSPYFGNTEQNIWNYWKTQ